MRLGFLTKLLIAVLALMCIGGTAFAPSVIDVHMVDFAFNPTDWSDVQGGLVTWGNDSATNTHSTTSNQKFWTEDAPPATTRTVQFNQAGTFRYHCRFHAQMTGRVLIALVGPATGTKGVAFNVQWAAATITSPLVEDIQVKRPGDRGFSDWRTSQQITNHNYLPKRRGTYVFRARERNRRNGKASSYSQLLSVVVS